MHDFLEKLDDKRLNLIIIKDGKTLFSSSRDGMVPLLEAMDNLGLSKLSGSIVVDKMVGKATALLICFFKAKEIHTHIMSLRAKEVLDKFAVKYSSEKIVPEILNKFGTDICPFERTVLDVSEPEEGYKRLVSKFMKTQRTN